MQEAATADPGDAESAFDLQDAMCAIDFAIDTLASFAVGEQAEADMGAEEQLALIGKAMAAFDPGQVDTLEGLTAIAKAGPGAVAPRTKPGYVTPPRRCKVCSLACRPRRRSPTAASRSPKEKEAAVADTETQAEAVPAEAGGEGRRHRRGRAGD